MDKTYYFISDIHLGLQEASIEKKKERKLVELLYLLGETADEIFIVGDLYDYWFEYRRVYQKGFFRTLTALQDLVEKGILIHYLIGNHDFMHRDFFESEIGVKLYEDGKFFKLNETIFYIAHGDGLVQNDLGYKILKKVFRNKTIQQLYSFLHPDIGIKIASGTSKSSREYTSEKNYGESDGLLKAAQQKIDEGAKYVLFGHLHQRQNIKYKNGSYINLGSWLDKPCYGEFKNNQFRIVDWE
ncbi:MAG: UDP-2,3-diacylglucosamine diphosphatase [Ignavibacteria bacterium]|nr:UDP-2,3-diacylglucosamine diphosphatase [Ignavibacteria bacterium]